MALIPQLTVTLVQQQNCTIVIAVPQATPNGLIEGPAKRFPSVRLPHTTGIHSITGIAMVFWLHGSLCYPWLQSAGDHALEILNT